MRTVETTPYALACRFLGMREVAGSVHNPAIVAMLQLDAPWATTDETPWCSGFVNYVAWLLEVKRSHSLAARSWLEVGTEVPIEDAEPGFHVVILSRGAGPQPPRTVLAAPGHVGFFAGWDASDVRLLGGNQGNRVSIAAFPKSRILGIREL